MYGRSETYNYMQFLHKYFKEIEYLCCFSTTSQYGMEKPLLVHSVIICKILKKQEFMAVFFLKYSYQVDNKVIYLV